MTTLQEITHVRFVTLDVTTMTMIAVPDEDIGGQYDDWLFTPRLSPQREYIAGPMRGYDKWNFPAFDKARDERLALGIQVISPADLDRARGITEDTVEFDPADFTAAMRIDTYALLQCTGIFMLKGWEGSTGARYEMAVANKLDLDVTFDVDAYTGGVDVLADNQNGALL